MMSLTDVYKRQIEKFRTSTDRDLYPDTDWIGELLRKNTHNHRYTLNVRGGSARCV